LEECYVSGSYGDDAGDGVDLIKEKGVTVLHPRGDVQWGQTVAEYAMGMTIAALRRIPMTYNAMIAGHETWNYSTKPGKPGKPGQRGQQFGDDTDFLSGTIQGKRVRVIGVGNIGGRYAQWCQMMGADVAVWDPFAPDASFDLAGVTRCWGLDELVSDSDIFAPMVPLTDGTRGLVTAEHIRALPDRSLVLQMTRAKVCDTEALYKRVLDNELFLSADVFDEEPVPLDSPLLGRANVIHTPHNAGRTIDANHARADDGIARFRQR
jgi:phosphoglycerate dehydrogenase-like enzyme